MYCIHFQDRSAYSPAGKYVNINHAQTHECENWDREAAQFPETEYINGIFVAVCSSTVAAGAGAEALAKAAGVTSFSVAVPVIVALGADALTAVAAQSQRVPDAAPHAVPLRAAPAQLLTAAHTAEEDLESGGAPIFTGRAVR
jgi:hypothetical protein